MKMGEAVEAVTGGGEGSENKTIIMIKRKE